MEEGRDGKEEGVWYVGEMGMRGEMGVCVGLMWKGGGVMFGWEGVEGWEVIMKEEKEGKDLKEIEVVGGECEGEEGG